MWRTFVDDPYLISQKMPHFSPKVKSALASKMLSVTILISRHENYSCGRFAGSWCVVVPVILAFVATLQVQVLSGVCYGTLMNLVEGQNATAKFLLYYSFAIFSSLSHLTAALCSKIAWAEYLKAWWLWARRKTVASRHKPAKSKNQITKWSRQSSGFHSTPEFGAADSFHHDVSRHWDDRGQRLPVSWEPPARAEDLGGRQSDSVGQVTSIWLAFHESLTLHCPWLYGRRYFVRYVEARFWKLERLKCYVQWCSILDIYFAC